MAEENGPAVNEVKSISRVNSGYGPYRYVNDPTNDHYIWLWVNVYNGGNYTTHVNPNYFTLSTPKGYATNFDQVTFWTNYLDGTDVPPGKYVSGWLIFLMPKSDSYTLHFKGLEGAVDKKIVT